MKTYYVKYFEETVATLTEKDGLPYQLDIIEPRLMFYKFTKVLVFGKELMTWIKSRVRPESQRGFDRFTQELGVSGEGDVLYWNLFKKTQGVNVKDRLWLSNKEEVSYTDIPWNTLKIESIEKDAKYDSLLKLFTTKTVLNVVGACEKELVRLNGNLAILKRPLQDNTYDCACEEVCYNIAQELGIDAAPEGYLKDDYCYSIIDEKLDLIQAEDLLNTDNSSIKNIFNKLSRIADNDKVLVDYLRMVLFDILTRQVDRNLTNFGFYYTNNRLCLYELYDNGLSLFSTTDYKDTLRFNMGRDSSDEVLDFVVGRLKLLGVSAPFKGELTSEYLEKILQNHADYIKRKKNTDIKDIIDWVMRQYNNILSKFQ